VATLIRRANFVNASSGPGKVSQCPPRTWRAASASAASASAHNTTADGGARGAEGQRERASLPPPQQENELQVKLAFRLRSLSEPYPPSTLPLISDADLDFVSRGVEEAEPLRVLQVRDLLGGHLRPPCTLRIGLCEGGGE